ncbi:MAG TPA: hypothetical protein VFZ64_12055 [Nocardioidaceae bacterium]
MTLSANARLRAVSATVVLLGVTLAGCSEDADRLVSNAKACAELVRTSAGNLDEIERNLDNPQRLERTLRDAAADLEAEAKQVDGADAQQAADDLVTSMNRLAERAQRGEQIGLDDLRDANRALVNACS